MILRRDNAFDNKYECGFVILHYKTIDETRACLEPIFALDEFEKIALIIVDNSYIYSEIGKCYSTGVQ